MFRLCLRISTFATAKVADLTIGGPKIRVFTLNMDQFDDNVPFITV